MLFSQTSGLYLPAEIVLMVIEKMDYESGMLEGIMGASSVSTVRLPQSYRLLTEI